MNFLETIKRDMYNEEQRRSLRNKCVVDTRSLRVLIDDYEKFDSFARAQSDMHAGLEHKLSNVLYALYCENHDSERLMLLVMDILKPLIEKRINETAIDNIYNRG